MHFVRFVFISLIAMILVCYVYNKSILSYVVQQYHYASDMISVQMPFFEMGDTLANEIESIRLSLFDSIMLEASVDNGDFKENFSQDFKEDSKGNQTLSANSKPSDNKIENAKTDNEMKKIPTLKPQTRFLLIGDSLMQGIGMTLPRMLQQHGFRVKNIAKQSTGLTYPSFFNWEQATKQAFKQYDDIGVIVVCLGANDPWNMPKVRFGTNLWEQTYKDRIQAIFDIAKEHNAIVIWYAVPATKNATLNKKLNYLNNLYKEAAFANNGIFITSEAILQNGEFSPYIKDDMGKSRLVRTSDGIHFTRYGATLLSQMLLDSLNLQ